ncbi:MAG: methyltransferase domain-containing protein [Verrucomicrobiota bacterium]
MPTWDASLYLKFGKERTQPSIDLAARIQISEPGRIVDLGCGPGNSTEVLAQKWPNAEIVGLDNSSEMIHSASLSFPKGKWILSDIASWTSPEPVDLLFSNAALQWVPQHEILFPHLMNQTYGAFAAQIPAHYDSKVNLIVQEVAMDSQWRDRMEGPRQALIKKSPGFYYDLLQPLSSRLEMWETEYIHIMESHQSILEWFRGTGLRPFLQALPEKDLQIEFEKQVLDGYCKAYPLQKDGRVLFPFRRLFFVAYK